MAKRIVEDGIIYGDTIYDTKCAHCGEPVNTPEAWREHKLCEKYHQSFKEQQIECKDCKSPNLQPAGGCMVCVECGWESCKG